MSILHFIQLQNELMDLVLKKGQEGAFYQKNGNEIPIPSPRVVEIGRILNDEGGFNRMLSMVQYFQKLEGTNARELEFAWNGIGSWQA